MKSIKKEYPRYMEYRNEQGDYHRTDGHAIESNSGYKAWYINGKRHREDGPAIECGDGRKSWYLNNIRYTEEEYQEKLIELKLKRLIEL